MLSYGCGELSGTSMTRKPAVYRTSPMAGASSGRRPRRIATRPFCTRACLSMSVLYVKGPGSGRRGGLNQTGLHRDLPEATFGGLFRQGHLGKAVGIEGALI